MGVILAAVVTLNSPDEDGAFLGGQCDHGVWGSDFEAGAEHHSGLRPWIGLLDSQHARNDCSVTLPWEVSEMKAVCPAPNVRSRASMNAAGLGIIAAQARAADILRDECEPSPVARGISSLLSPGPDEKDQDRGETSRSVTCQLGIHCALSPPDALPFASQRIEC